MFWNRQQPGHTLFKWSDICVFNGYVVNNKFATISTFQLDARGPDLQCMKLKALVVDVHSDKQQPHAERSASCLLGCKS